jgi:hypothetical protein
MSPGILKKIDSFMRQLMSNENISSSVMNINLFEYISKIKRR